MHTKDKIEVRWLWFIMLIVVLWAVVVTTVVVF